MIVGCLCVSSLFMALRAIARWLRIRRAPVAGEDLASYVALSSFIIMCALYLAIIKTYYPLVAVSQGEMPPYPGLESDTAAMLREFLAVQFFFWGALWAVKVSLLLTVKSITDGLPFWGRIWWAIMAFTTLTYVGCCITQFTSCSSFQAWLTASTQPYGCQRFIADF